MTLYLLPFCLLSLLLNEARVSPTGPLLQTSFNFCLIGPEVLVKLAEDMQFFFFL